MIEQPDPEGDEDLPADLVVLLTPVSDICSRIDLEELTDYVVAFSAAIDAYFRDDPASPGSEFQAACALHSGSRKLLQIDMTPSDSETTDRLRSLVDAIAVPNTILGPVAFFRRIRSGETKKDGGLGMPFLQHVRAAGPVWLDDVITSALPALPPPPTKSIWNRWSKRDRDKPKHIVSFVPEDEVTPMMSRRLNVPVIICNGRISLN